MPEQLIELKLIDPNPKQKRLVYKDIPELARTIASDGLQQIPKARFFDKRVQIKFGHRRREAFLWLRDNWKKEGLPDRYNGYSVMPLDIEDLTDEQMFRGVTIENSQREDLSAIERMEEMKAWVEFGYNSKQIADMYPGMSDATVRGLLAFDALYPEVKDALHLGQITQGTARLFISMQKIAPKEKIISTLHTVIKKEGKELPDEVIEQSIHNLNNTVRLWYGEGKPKAGHSGWDLDMKKFPNHLLPAMTEQQVGDFEAQLDHLIDPPACTACPFYTKVRGTHFCGLKFCFDRKTAAYQKHAVELASQKTKIKIYSKEDGAYRALIGYDSASAKAFESRHEGLRLLPKTEYANYAYQSFKGLDDDLVVVVATGSLLDKLSSTSTRGRTQGSKKSEKEKAEMRAKKIYRIKRLELMWEYTAAAQTIFESTPMKALKRLNEWKNIMIDDRIPDEYDHPQTGNAAQQLTFQRRELVWRLIMNKTSWYSRSGLVEALHKFAEVTGVNAPKTLVKRAEEWDAEIKAAASVSTATEKGKKT